MSSPFQKKFTSKSPLNGNYYSGVDGLQYVSPKIPESKTPADPKTKLPKTPETTPIIPEDVGTTPRVPETPADVENKREEFKNLRTKEKVVPGAKVEKVETDKEKYLASFEPGFARDPEGSTTIQEYIRKKEGKYRDKILLQDQQQLGDITNGVTTTGDWMNVGEEYEKN